MGFGKRVGNDVRTDLRADFGTAPPTVPLRTGRRTPPWRTALAGLILGFGGVTAGTGLVHASDRGGLLGLFDQLFGAPASRPAQVPRPEAHRPRRFTSLPDAGRVTAARPRRFTPRPPPEAKRVLPDLEPRARRARRGHEPSRPESQGVVAPAGTGPLSVCVRTCDGYLFPLGTLRTQQDVPLHEAACTAACPGAPTALYTLPAGQEDLDRAVGLTGQPYLAAAWANLYRRQRVKDCHCREPGLVTLPLPIGSDPTTRVGDIVASAHGAHVVTGLVRGAVQSEDYRTTRSLSRAARQAVDQRVGTLRREADQRAFLQVLRKVGTSPVRVAEARSARIRLEAAGPAPVAPPVPAPGFAPVRVLVPSPYGP